MKYKILLLSAILLLVSCKEKTYVQMRIILENRTENDMEVQLFPKSPYDHGEFYQFRDYLTGYRFPYFTINPNRAKEFFISNQIDTEPYRLAQKGFDSIYIAVLREGFCYTQVFI